MNRKERRGAGAAPDRHRHRQKLETAFAQHQQGDLAGAERIFRQILAVQPDHPDAMRMLGEVLNDLGRFADSIALLRRAVALQPGNTAALYSLGNAYRLGGQADAAITAYRASLALNPDFAGSHHGLGTAYRQAEREREALEHFRHAARLQPGWAVVWKDLGLTFARLGDLAMAEAALSRAVSLQPSLGDAQRHLAALRGDPASEAERASLAARAQDPALPAGERIELHFALGRLADKAGDHDNAYRHYAEGNRQLRAELAQAGKTFDRQRFSQDIDRIIATYTPDAFAPFAGWGNPTEQPVFIVGMPRAGSTLFEQIAASHPKVFGAGERYAVGAIAQRLGWAPSPAWTETAIAAAAAEYLASLPVTNAARIIDKMPDNIFQLGLIAVLFRNARVVFCERDPRDLAISCFFQHFSEAHGYDTDLEDIGFRIRELERLKRHWLKTLPLQCLSLSYEKLLASPEFESRRLIDFLGLGWDEKCLDFHLTERVVRTASWAQVRKPLYSDKVGYWKNYEPHLGALLKALG